MRSAKVWFTAAVMVALVAGMAAPKALAARLDEAEIFFEINDTDGDGGIQVFLDGEGWDEMQMIGPNGDVMFHLLAESSVGMQGITEFSFESAEPSFDEQTLEELLELFPEGKYRLRGRTTEGRTLRGTARLTHALPDAPVQLFPIDGEEVDPNDAVFFWQLVADPPGSRIDRYQVIVECEEPVFRVLDVLVGPTVDSLTVPPELLLEEGADECKWEVLAIERSGNQTISETEFGI